MTDTFQPELRIADRCDVHACGAQAFVMTLHGEDRLPLLWCAHHAARFEVVVAGCIAVDNRDQINKAASVSAY